MKRNSLLKFLTTTWSNVNFHTQVKTNCKVCRIMRRVSVFFVVVHSFGQRGKANQFLTKVEHSVLIVGSIVGNFHQWLGSLVAVRSKLLLMRSLLKDWFSGVASGCFWMILTKSYRLYMDNLSIFGNRNNELHIWKVFFFFDIQFKFHQFLDFQTHSLRNGNKQSDCSCYVTSVLTWKKNLHLIYQVLSKFILWRLQICQFLCFYEKHDFDADFLRENKTLNQTFSHQIRFWSKIFTTFQVLKWKCYNVSKNESIFWTSIWFWTQYFTRCAILSLPFVHFAMGLYVHQDSARSGIVLMYCLGSVIQVVIKIDFASPNCDQRKKT